MNRTALQLALRDLQAIAVDPRALTVYGAITAIFALSGPFGTSEALEPIPRAGYWLVVMAFAWGVVLAHVVVAMRTLEGRRLGRLRVGGAAAAMIGGALAAPAMTAGPHLLNALALGAEPSFGGWAQASLANAPVCAAVAALVRLGLGAGDAAPKDRGPPAILSRLPPERRGRLLRLSMQDHYVEVVTDRGAELILLRLSDAIVETAPEEGLQVHRSHWVARAAVAEARRTGLRLTDGSEVPVSRARVAALREAGWL